MSIPPSCTIDPYLKEIDLEPDDFYSSIPVKKVTFGDVFEAARAGDVDRLRYLLKSGVNVNARDQWDSVPLYYACLAGHFSAAWLLVQRGAICSKYTFDGDRCHYAALNSDVRDLLKAFEARLPPLAPLQSALRETFLNCPANMSYHRQLEKQSALPDASLNGKPSFSHFPPDFMFYVQGFPIEVHRVILSARSPFFKKKFENEWKDRQQAILSKEKLYHAFHRFIDFFYSDRLEIAVSDMQDLVRICKVCKCESLRVIIYNELIRQKYIESKTFRDVDNSQKRYILQGRSLPEEDRLPAALNKILQVSLANSSPEVYDLADVCVRVDDKKFRCHQVVLASRSDYFKVRFSHLGDFLQGSDGIGNDSLPCIEENGLSADAFEKIVEYMYTDDLKEIDLDQVEEIFDAASRYLLLPLKRVVIDALLPRLEMISPAETCHWLILSDMYGVVKIREYCLNAIACNFETFAEAPEFRALLLSLPAPSGDSSLRTTAPSTPGSDINNDQGNLLDDLREKWLEIEAAELDKRDQSALLFDKRLEMLVVVAEQEKQLSDD